MAPKPRKRWDKKAEAKAAAAKLPTALEAAAEDRPPPPPPDPAYVEGQAARQNGEGSFLCPYLAGQGYASRVQWMTGWSDADKAFAPAPAGNKGGTVMRRAAGEAARE